MRVISLLVICIVLVAAVGSKEGGNPFGDEGFLMASGEGSKQGGKSGENPFGAEGFRVASGEGEGDKEGGKNPFGAEGFRVASGEGEGDKKGGKNPFGAEAFRVAGEGEGDKKGGKNEDAGAVVCVDDPTGEVKAVGMTCALLKGMTGCETDLQTLKPDLAKGSFVKLACPVTCDACKNPFGAETFRVASGGGGGDKKGGKKGDSKDGEENPFGAEMRVSAGSVNIALPTVGAAAATPAGAATATPVATALPNGIPAAGTILGRASGLNNWQSGSVWTGSYTPYNAAPAAWGALPYSATTSNWATPAATTNWATTFKWATPAATSNWATPAATSNWATPAATSNWATPAATTNWAAPASSFSRAAPSYNGFNGGFQSFGFGR